MVVLLVLALAALALAGVPVPARAGVARGLASGSGRLSHAAALASRRAQVRAGLSKAHERAVARAAVRRKAARQERLSPAAVRRKVAAERKAAAKLAQKKAAAASAPAAGRAGPATEAVGAVRLGQAATSTSCSPVAFILGETTVGVTGTLPDQVGVAVFTGEQLTASIELWDFGCSGYSFDLTFEYQCRGVFSSTVSLGEVTPPEYDNFALSNPPGLLVSHTFQISPSVCAAGAGSWGPYGLEWLITATPVGGGTGATSTANWLSVYSVPPGQLTGCPAAGNSAWPAQDQLSCGDPVNTAAGDFAAPFTDAQLATPGYRLPVSRNYDSALTAAGPLGPGWTMPWFASLTVDSSTGYVTFNSENGSSYVYAYDGTSYYPPPGARSLLAQTSSGGYTLTTPAQDVLTFTSAGQLVSETDPTGRGLSFAYSGGQLTSVTDAAGQQVTLSYSGGLLTQVGLPDGQNVSYGYTGGLLTSVTTPGGTAGETTSYAYNSSGQLTSITDADGHLVLQNTYDSQGRVTSQADGAGAVTTFSYTTTSGGLPETDVTSPDGGITTVVYGGGVALETVNPADGTTSFFDNGWLEPVQVTDPLGNITSEGYDSNGNLTSLTSPLGNQQQWAYDASNNLTSATDALGNTTTYTYNSMDEPTSVTDPAGDESTYAYNSSGELTSSVAPRGNVSGANAASYTTAYTYDAAGQLASVTNPDGGTATYTYNAMGYPLSVTDPASRVVSYSYDTAGQLTSVTGPGGGTTSYGYDGDSHLTSLTGPGGSTWTYTYNADGEQASVTDPLGNTTSYGYDGDGNLASVTDARGITTTTSYDTSDRPVKITYSDSTPTVTYGYDADGNITSVTDATGSRNLTYNADGELTQATVPGTGPFTYAYNADGQVTSRAYPDGTTLAYTYNTDGLPASMTDGSAATTYAYNPDGNLTTTTLPNSVTETRGYDNAGRLTSITDTTAGATLDAYNLTLNPDGQPTQAATTQNGTAQPTWYYTYGTSGRLATACQTTSTPSSCSTASGGGETAWTYNKAGDILTKATSGFTTNYQYNAGNELTGAGCTAIGCNINYVYDADGNRTGFANQRGVENTTTYDANNRPVTITTPNSGTTYTYDSAGNLATATTGTQTTSIIWDPNNTLPLAAEQTTSTGTTDLTYNPSGTLNTLTASGTTNTAVTDWLGSVTGLISPAGTQVTTTTYTPHGNATTTGSPASPIGYAGSYTIPGSAGLDYMHARDYSPATATFTSPDPLTALTSQPYAYAADTPTSATDPTGLCPTSFLGGAGPWLLAAGIIGLGIIATVICPECTLAALELIADTAPEDSAALAPEDTALTAAQNEAAALRAAKAAGQLQGRLPTATAAAVDRTTGEVVGIGHSGDLAAPPPGLESVLPKPSLEPWSAWNCAEVAACGEALAGGSSLENLAVRTVRTVTGDLFPPCDNCQVWLPGR